MKRDAIITFILRACFTIAAFVCGAIVSSENAEWANKGFDVSDEETTISAAGWLTLIFGVTAILSLIVGFIMHANDKTFEESLKKE